MRVPAASTLLGTPGRLIVAAFGGTIFIGTGLLLLPVAHTGAGRADWLAALFTATTSVCVTGQSVVDIASYWTGFGEAVIVGLVQLGGLGIMSAASLLGLLVSRRMGLRTRITTAAETNQLGIGDVRRVLLGVVRVSLLFEAVVAVILFLRFWLAYDEAPARAAWLGVFHSVMAFNQAGLSLYPDSLERFVTDPWICVPVAVSVIAGSLGFPVLFELRHEIFRPRGWSVHTKITITATAVLLPAAMLLFTVNEWGNPATLGPLDTSSKLLAGFFQSAMPRSAGLNSIDFGQVQDGTLLGTVALMFIGGAPAGTAGGIKVTTFVLLLFVMVAEVRGDRDVTLFRRRMGHRVQRQALAVALLSLLTISVATFLLTTLAPLSPGVAVFEATSAFTTTGLSTGVTGDLPPVGQITLMVLMFLGRLGPITLVSALALRERPVHFTYPEGRPIIG